MIRDVHVRPIPKTLVQNRASVIVPGDTEAVPNAIAKPLQFVGPIIIGMRQVGPRKTTSVFPDNPGVFNAQTSTGVRQLEVVGLSPRKR